MSKFTTASPSAVEQPVPQRAAVVGFVAVLDAHFGELGCELVGDRERAVGRAVLDDEHFERLVALAQPSTTALTDDARISASLKAGITTEMRGAVMRAGAP